MFFSIRVGGYDRGEGVFSAVRILPTPYAIIVWILHFRCTYDFSRGSLHAYLVVLVPK